jgi:hypothetical protein
MQSPFKIFRKHQKGVMVVMVFTALILFGIGDIFIRMQRSGGSAQSSKPVVETTAGNLTQAAMNNLMMQRRVVHRFIGAAYQKSHPEEATRPYFGLQLQYIVGHFGFGGVSPGEMLYTWLYRQEARKMGIVVDDKQIEAYIDRFTNHKLSTRMFREIVDEMPMRIGAKQLFDMFREELQADIAQKMKLPAYLPSPAKYWEYYQRINTRERIEVASLPVRDFVEGVADPTDAQIAALFEKHKDEFESAIDSEFKPGFRQPRKVRLHYLALTSGAIDDKLHASGPVTDKEIEDYYERYKDTDKDLHELETAPIDESAPLDPDFVPEKGPALEPDSDEKPDETSKSDCGAAASDDDAKPQTKDDTDKPDAAKPPAKEQGDEDAASTTGDKEVKSDEPAAGTGKKKREPSRIKYKPLDDSLRDNIREKVLQERREKIMKEESDRAFEAMRDAGARLSTSPDIKLTEPNAEQLKMIERRSEEELRKIADSLGMKFDKTPLINERELTEIPGLGRAVEAGMNDAPRSDIQTIVDLAFGSEALCRVFKAEAINPEASYIAWKVQDAPVHVPRLTEPGIREQVVNAWKRVESLPLARKRATELADRIRKQGNDLKAALAGETVTGNPRGLAVTVSGESPEFSFYRDSSAPSMFGQRGPSIALDKPIVVNNPGRKFMKVVFDELGPDDVGIALNDDASVYYVVKVTSRRPADREAFKDAPLFSPPYNQVAQLDFQEALREYNGQMAKTYAVKWNDAARHEMGPMEEE